jgi:uncharacterized membrane protein YphA (DoxX/SURF4 family)
MRMLTGIAFVIAGLPKFVLYGWEHDAFVRFGLPQAWLWVIAAGVIEIGGGILLLRERWVRPTAVVLAATMGVAIGVSGVKEGDVIPSLTVAPLLLAACLYLLLSAHADRHPRRVLPR